MKVKKKFLGMGGGVMLLPDEFGINVDTGDVIYDTPDLQLGVLEDVPEEGGLACDKSWRNSWVQMKI